MGLYSCGQNEEVKRKFDLGVKLMVVVTSVVAMNEHGTIRFYASNHRPNSPSEFKDGIRKRTSVRVPFGIMKPIELSFFCFYLGKNN